MPSKVVVHKNRTNVVPLDLGIDCTGDTITSQIRAEADHTSALIATWVVTEVDESLGQYTLTLDDAATSDITVDSGYMDIRRVSGGEPLVVLDKPLEVRFQGTVTA